MSQEQVKRYILEQEGKDMFEYDIFNCPKELEGQLKIGDFTRWDFISRGLKFYQLVNYRYLVY